ncbi:MAG TPA: GNAT family N-acetyltransferase [Coprothermobacter sp.]|jgi:ribosomal protein S18 acetylase RimI-like enzyme|nr:GNAT family N-acetyltransferase [Coprothermobacter sp.]
MVVRKGTLKDKNHFSELVLLAAPFFSKLFGEERAVELLQLLYEHDNNLFSFSHCLFAQDGDILGLVMGYDWQTKQREQLGTGYLMIKHLGLQFFKVLPALLKLDAQVSRISREDYYIAFLAVYQQVQTRGVGTALMKRAEEDAVSCGAKFVCLDVETENENAVQFYEKRGYTIERTFSVNLTQEVVLHFHRMKKEVR